MHSRALDFPLNMLSFAAFLFGIALGVNHAAAAVPETPHYTVTFDAQRRHAAVRLCLTQAHDTVHFAADSGWAMRFIDATRRSGEGSIETEGDGWRALHWRAGECLEYGADIGAIARSDKVDVGWQMGDDLVAAPQLWLLRVDGDLAEAQVDVSLPSGWSISAPWRAAGATAAVHKSGATSSGGQTAHFSIPRTPADWSAAVAFGRFEEERIALPGGVLRLTILHGTDLHGADPAQRAMLHKWFDRISQAILSAYGRLPLPEVQVLMIPIEGHSHGHGGVLFGQSVRGQGNSLQLLVDPTRPATDFDDDWMAVHELSHLMHPYLGDRGAWLAEGLATYYQNVLRARAGLLTPAQAWGELADGFARGASTQSTDTLEDAAARMHHTHAFQRIYWAGAAFWLTVDNDLRRDSGDTIGLDTVLGRFGACCLPAYREWQPEDFVARLDALAGTSLIAKRYREFAAQRVFPDWTGVLSELGVDRDGHPRNDGARARGEAIMRLPQATR